MLITMSLCGCGDSAAAPSHAEATKQILQFIRDNVSPDAFDVYKFDYDNGFEEDGNPNKYIVSGTVKIRLKEDMAQINLTPMGKLWGRDFLSIPGGLNWDFPKNAMKGAPTGFEAQYEFLKTEKGWILQGLLWRTVRTIE
jgi:hypothetical protein